MKLLIECPNRKSAYGFDRSQHDFLSIKASQVTVKKILALLGHPEMEACSECGATLEVREGK